MSGGAKTAVLIDRRFDEALNLVLENCRLESLPGSSLPKIGHLLGVAALVGDDGGDADQAIAALLHDEPCRGYDTVAEIGRRFGPRVERMVVAVTDGFEPNPQRRREDRQAHLDRLADSPAESWRVSLADALSHARYFMADVRNHGGLALEAADGESLLWYHRALADAFRDLAPGAMRDEYERVVSEMESAAR